MTVRTGNPLQPMSFRNLTANTALWFRAPAADAIRPYEALRQTSDVVVLHIAILVQDRLAVLRRLRGKRGAARVLILAVYDEERKALPIRTEGEKSPGNFRQQSNPKCSWINAMVWTLLAGCCALTLFFAFQAPFRLRATENQTSAVEFRAETAALPAGLGTQTMSRFRPNASHQGGYDKEVASSSVDDSRHKRRLSRELVQHKHPQVCSESGQFSGHN